MIHSRTDLRHLWADPRRLYTQLLLLLLHLRVRLGPQVVRYNLMAEHWDAQLREFLQGAVNGKVREIAKRKKKKKRLQ